MIGTEHLVAKSRENPLSYYAAELQGPATFFSLKPSEMTSHLPPLLIYEQSVLFL